MQLTDDDTALLRTWIIKKLESMSDADSDVLADYVLALAQTEGPLAAAKAACVENLQDFLLDNTNTFVDELFSAITTKSFDPSRPPSKPAVPLYQAPKRSSFDQPRLPNESRKRSYHDWDREETSNGNGNVLMNAERPVKQARRGGRGRDHRGRWQMQASNHHNGSQLQQGQLPPMPTPPPGMPRLDPNTPLAALFAMQQAMGLLSGMPNFGSPNAGNEFNQFQPKQRCVDYDTKGYCAAGASCPYEHGNDPYVIPGQEYDPNNAGLLDVRPNRTGHVDASNDGAVRGGARRRGRGHGTGDYRGGGKRADFSQTAPNRDKSVTDIVIEQIPDDECNEQSVRDFFSEFGDIQEVIVRPEQKLAIVKYDSNEAARAAYQSPNVVFNNRFVKVYGYKPGKMASASRSVDHAHGRTQDVEMHESEQLDLAEISQRQEEAQRRHDEARRQREDAAKRKQDLDAQLKKMEAEKKEMAELLARKSARANGSDPNSSEADGSQESEKTKALKAQLAKVQAEAESLGIDPDAESENGFPNYSNYRGHSDFRSRGGYRGRPRGRGSFPSYRGGWSGSNRGGGAVMRLDNRPKTISITFLNGSSYEANEEAMRQYLLFNSMESATLSRHPEREDAALVTFGQRYEGENFLVAVRGGGGEMGHVGRVELGWWTAATAPPAASPLRPANGEQGTAMDVGEKSGAATASSTGLYENGDEEDLDRWN